MGLLTVNDPGGDLEYLVSAFRHFEKYISPRFSRDDILVSYQVIVEFLEKLLRSSFNYSMLEKFARVLLNVAIPPKVKIMEEFNIIFKIFNNSNWKLSKLIIADGKPDEIEILRTCGNIKVMGNDIVVLEEIKPKEIISFEIVAKTEKPENNSI